MRSSKSRSRSKSNRPRTLGNVTNRVFDSSGPEGKVRGTPQQIIDKYLILARDAQLSNDRVAAENFMQHAEHYTRMLGEAQREQAAEQEARRAQEQQNQQPRERQERGDRPDRGSDGGFDNRGDIRGESRPDDRRDRRQDRDADTGRGANGDVIDLDPADEDSGLVETPEARRPSRNRTVKRRGNEADTAQPDLPLAADAASATPRTVAPKPVAPKAAASEAVTPETATPVAPASKAEAPVQAEEKPAKRPRAPRKPKTPKAEAAPGSAGDQGPDSDPRAAAE